MRDVDTIHARSQETDRRRGLMLAAASVLLVSVAQLLLKFGVMHIAAGTLTNTLSDWRTLLPVLTMPMALLPLAAGMICYGASMFCWLAALGHLPLNLAYPLLSLSYPLVYAGAALLPSFDEALNAQRLAGIALIMLGVALLMARRR